MRADNHAATGKTGRAAQPAGADSVMTSSSAQAEIPHLGAVVGYELYQAGDAQRTRQHDVLCKDGQHHIADKLHDTV